MSGSEVRQAMTATEVLVLLIPFHMRLAVLPGKVEVGPAQTRLVPCLAISMDSEVLYPDEIFQWAKSLLAMMSLAQARKKISSVGRLFQFWASTSKLPILIEEDVDVVVWSFLYERLNCASDVGLRTFPHWHPISYTTAVAEFADIRAFVQFCRKQSGVTTVLSKALASDSKLFDFKLRRAPKSDFFSHLAAQRNRWTKLLGIEASYPRSIARGKSRRSHSRKAERTFAEEDASAIIDFEKNLMFKMLWILLAYTGIRVSEALHLWRCDILPGSYSRKFTDFSMEGVPFVILAHPEGSTYTGLLERSDADLSRRDFLLPYGRNPRTEPRPEHQGEQVGWKGMMEYDPNRALRWAYWIDVDRAHEFESYLPILNQIHIRAGTEKSHPYFFVNSRNAKYLGAPMRIGNVEQAFEAACRRCGVRTGRNGFSLHSYRHFYKWTSREKLGLPLEIVQEMMGHGSIDSTREYGLRAVDTYRNLTSAFGGQSWR